MKTILSILVVVFFPFICVAQYQIASPNGNILFNFKLTDQSPTYSLYFKGQSVLNKSEISFTLNDFVFKSKLHVLKPTFRGGNEEYDLIVGKTSHVNDPFKEVIIPLEDESKKIRINWIVHAFNDGIAFRYEFVSFKGEEALNLMEEVTSFKFAGNPLAHALILPNYTTSHEGFYTNTTVDQIKEGSLMDLPTLFELKESIFVAITEAALVDYAGMYLTKNKGVIETALSPLPNKQLLKVKAGFPHKSPWRIIMMSDRIGDLIESNIVTNLNEPLAIKDVSWIKPGKTTWPWWNGNVLPDTINAPGNNFITQQYYIDFCARNGIEYHSVVEYGLHQWYVDDGISFMPGPHSNVLKTVPGLNMKEVCDYAKSKGVGTRVWVHWWALYPKLDSAFAQFEKWGLSGLMIDFMDRDDQEMVNIQNEMLRKAATYHLHVQFHGAYKPTGLHRTYPNEFTREGTLNYEINKWDAKGLPPEHDIMIPFTRMLAGSTDYHLGGFRAVPRDKFVRQYTRPLMLGTRCHMLALYVVLESYLGLVSDYPLAYEGEPGFDFIKSVPTVWDETKVVDSKVGEYVIIARRKGSDWYLGAITNQSARTINVSLGFLKEGNFEAHSYLDASDSEANPNHIQEVTKIMTSAENIQLLLSSGGGMAARFKKLNK
jgi:alpha-glucosidase